MLQDNAESVEKILNEIVELNNQHRNIRYSIESFGGGLANKKEREFWWLDLKSLFGLF